MKHFKLFLRSLTLLLLMCAPLASLADREVKQPVFDKQIITVAEDEVITFVDPKGDTDYKGQTSENCQGMTVFKPAVEGKSVQITFEFMNMGGANSYYSVANVYAGNPDANDSFSWASSTSTVPSSYSASVLPSGDILRAYPNEKGKTYENETYFSTTNDGILSVAFAYRYAYECKGWKATVKLVSLDNMQTTGAAADYSSVPTSVKSKQGVIFAGATVTTQGVMNADVLRGIRVHINKNQGMIDPASLVVYDSGNNALQTVSQEAEGDYLLSVDKTLTEGNNSFTVRGDILESAEIGAEVEVAVTGVVTTAFPEGVTPFTAGEAPTLFNPALVLMSSTPQTITVGDTPLAFFDQGGADGKIKQNLNGTVTFVPATEGKKVMIDVTKLNIWLGSYYVQEFRIYNGTEVKADQLIKTLNNGETAIVRSTSDDGALTINLFSNTTATTYENDGWEATVSQFTPQAMTIKATEASPASTATCSAGDMAEMLKIKVTTENTEPALVPSTFSIDCGANYELVNKVAIYSTATSETFSSAKKIGEADVTAQNVTITASTSIALIEGDNYLWVAYTLSPAAKSGQKISAKLDNIKFTNDATATDPSTIVAERTIKNIAIATEGTKTVIVDGTFGIQSEQYADNPNNYSAPGTTDRILIFKPANEGYVCQVEFSDMEVYYSSSSYGSKCKFIVYSGEGTTGKKLLEVTAPTSGSYYKETGKLLRSTSADGALTIVYNPNASAYYYCGKGFTGVVTEYLTQDQKVEAITATQSSTAAVAAGGKKQAMLDLNVKTIGTANPISLSQLNVNLKGTEASVEKVELYQGTTLLGAATATEGDIAINLSQPASLEEGDNTFLLCVDIKSDADADAIVDLKAVSAIIGDKTENITDGDPEGERVVKYIYTLTSGDNGVITITDKSLMFYDDGGADSNAGRNLTGNVTFKPATEGKAIKLTFKALKLGAYSDKMNVSDGATVKATADKAYGYYDTSNPYGYDTQLPEAYVSKADDGSVTIQWITGTSTTAISNFAIEVSCYEKVPLAVTDIQTTAGETTEVLKGSEGIMMQKIALTVEGDKDNVAISHINIAATQSTAFGTAKIYATGTASAFAANNLIGQSTTAGDIAINYTITKAGTYYLWVTYDVPTTVAVGDKASASVTSLTANGNAIPVATPTTAEVAVISGKSGTYTVGIGCDYATIQSAINSLAIGVEGPVTLSIKPGTYNEHLMIPAIKGASAINSITIKGAGQKRGNVKIYHDQYSAPAYGQVGTGVITFDGANYVTLQNLTVATEDLNYEAVVYIRNASRHITIDGCYLSAPFTTNTQTDINIIGHHVDNSKDANGNYLQNNNNDYLTIKNNVIEGGYIGINMGGTSYVALPKEVGGVIENNIVRNQGSKAIYVMEEMGAQVNNNIIYNVAATGSSFCGLDMQVGEDNTLPVSVMGNTVYLANSNSAGGLSFRKLNGTAENPVVIDHNEVRVVSKYAATFGVKFTGSVYQNINFHHNTIRVTPDASPISTGSTALWFSSKITTGNSIVVANNIAQTEGADAGFAANLYNDSNLDFITFKDNTLYTGGATFARASSSTTMDYATWTTKTAETGGQNTLIAYKDEFRLFPSAEVGDRGAHPYDSAQQPATRALGDPADDEDWGTPEAEPSAPELELATAEDEVELGESYELYLALTEGTAPYTLTISNGNNIIKEATITELPTDFLTYEITPTENADYLVKVVDANEKSAEATIRLITTGAQVVATFESLSLKNESSFSGIYELEDEEDFSRESTFVNGTYSFYQGTMPDYDTWWGIGYANHTGTSYATLADQFNNCVGAGADGSSYYAVAYYMEYMGPGYEPSVTITNKEEGDIVAGMYVTNTAYAALSMEKGDDYAKKFGYGDWLKLTATGYNANGTTTVSTDFYLADFRSDNADERYIVKDWRYMDLSVLGKVKKIVFTMSSSDSGSWGMNTPAYFAFDNFGASRPASLEVNDEIASIQCEGSLDAATLTSLVEKSSLSFAMLDLSTNTLAEDVDASVIENLFANTNILTKLSDESTISGTNIICNASCANLVLTDKQDFCPAEVFTALNATYSKDVDGKGWYSAVLPYEASIPSGVRVLNNAEIGNGSIRFAEITDAGTIPANTPFLYLASSEGTIAFTAANVSIDATPTTNSGELLGTYVNIPEGDATGKLILNSTGSAFGRASASASIPAFRAYIEDANNLMSNVFTILIDNNLTGIMDSQADINTLVDVYSLDGRLVRKSVKAITALQGLANGTYIINGTTVIKK